MRTAEKTELGSRRIYQLLSRLCRKNSAKNTEDFQGDDFVHESKIQCLIYMSENLNVRLFTM